MAKPSDLPSGLGAAGLKGASTSEEQEQKDSKGDLKPRSVTSKERPQIVCKYAFVDDFVRGTKSVEFQFPVRGKGKNIEKKVIYNTPVHLLSESDDKEFIVIKVDEADGLNSILLRENFGDKQPRIVPFDKIRELNPLCDLPERVHVVGLNGKYKITKILSMDTVFVLDEEAKKKEKKEKELPKAFRVEWYQIVECRLRRGECKGFGKTSVPAIQVRFNYIKNF